MMAAVLTSETIVAQPDWRRKLIEALLAMLDPPVKLNRYSSLSVAGFWLRAEWLWETPLPAVEDVLLEIAGEAYARNWIEKLKQKGFLNP